MEGHALPSGPVRPDVPQAAIGVIWNLVERLATQHRRVDLRVRSDDDHDYVLVLAETLEDLVAHRLCERRVVHQPSV